MEIPYQIDDIYSMYSTNPANDSIYISTSNGVLLFQPKEPSFKLFDITCSSQTSNKVRELYRDKTGNIWIFTDQPGITRLNMQTGEKRHYLSPSQSSYQYEFKTTVYR